MASDRPPEDGGRQDRNAEDTALAKRLQKLGEELGALVPTGSTGANRNDEGETREPGRSTQIGRALRLSGDFIGGIIVGAFLGWLFDRLTGLSPWGFLIFILLGFAAGTLNALRSAGLMAAQGTPRENGTSKD